MRARGVAEEDLPPAAVVDEQWMWIWRAFHRLHADRPYRSNGMDPPTAGRIPWAMVMQWAREYRLADGERSLLDACIVKMDGVFLMHEQSAKEK